jgi:hypothetical protein
MTKMEQIPRTLSHRCALQSNYTCIISLPLCNTPPITTNFKTTKIAANNNRAQPHSLPSFPLLLSPIRNLRPIICPTRRPAPLFRRTPLLYLQSSYPSSSQTLPPTFELAFPTRPTTPLAPSHLNLPILKPHTLTLHNSSHRY